MRYFSVIASQDPGRPLLNLSRLRGSTTASLRDFLWDRSFGLCFRTRRGSKRCRVATGCSSAKEVKRFMQRSRLIRALLGCAFLWLAGVASAAEVTVANLAVAQRPGTKLVDITYDLTVSVGTNATISLAVTNAGVKVNIPSVSGDIGLVSPGAGKRIVWNMGADWNLNLAELSFCLSATPRRPEGGDPMAKSWIVINSRWVQNFYGYSYITTMTDRNNALMWVNTCPDQRTWANSVSYCNNLTYADHSDWFLPSLSQLSAIYSSRTVFACVASYYYWSSTTTNDLAWYIYMSTGATFYTQKSNLYYTWPCRSASPLLPAESAQTLISYASMDSRDYRLAVYSIRGAPTPAIGTNIYAWRASVTCESPSVVISGVNWRSVGWSGSGSIPVMGATNTTGPIVLTSLVSSITWNWGTAFAITNLAAAQRPGTKLVDITYDIISDVTNTVPISFCVTQNGTPIQTNGLTGDYGANVSPGAAKGLVWDAGSNWNGNATALVFSVLHAMETQFVGSSSIPVDTRDYTLTVASTRGSPSPAVGTNVYAWRSTVTCSVEQAIVISGVNWRSTWSGAGSIPSSGMTNTTGAVILTNTESSITWNWVTAFSITNLAAAQRPGTKLVDITYDIISDITNGVPITLAIENSGTPVPTNGLTGTFGVNILPGAGKAITWTLGVIGIGIYPTCRFM